MLERFTYNSNQKVQESDEDNDCEMNENDPNKSDHEISYSLMDCTSLLALIINIIPENVLRFFHISDRTLQSLIKHSTLHVN